MGHHRRPGRYTRRELLHRYNSSAGAVWPAGVVMVDVPAAPSPYGIAGPSHTRHYGTLGDVDAAQRESSGPSAICTTIAGAALLLGSAWLVGRLGRRRRRPAPRGRRKKMT